MRWTRTTAACATAPAVALSAGITAQRPTRFALVTSSGTIGTLTVTENGRSVDTVYRATRKGRLVVKGGHVFYPDEIHESLGIKPFEACAAIRMAAAE